MNSIDRTAEGQVYQIRLRGRLAGDWREHFWGMEVLPGTAGETVLRGALPDQAALFGVLMRVRDLGMELLEVKPCEGPVPREVRELEPSQG